MLVSIGLIEKLNLKYAGKQGTAPYARAVGFQAQKAPASKSMPVCGRRLGSAVGVQEQQPDPVGPCWPQSGLWLLFG